FEGRSKASTWIFGIARYKVLDIVRTENKHQHDELDSEMLDEESTTPLDWVAALEDSKALQHCLNRLPDTHQEVVHLTFFQDMHYNKVAEIMQCPTGTIKSRMFHARQLLKRCLESFCPNILQKN
ncbi:MAG: sigma-70 family RNA polymerase sigma factor, partial [Mariprofundaceae bacterium]|nr:sigma-70 family RNA polymerase sigma factor [Mariprofundaceae bacterium]